MLRDYQIDIIDRLRKAWLTHRSVMVQMPTGTGKTHVLAAIVSEELRVKSEESDSNIGGVWVIAHRRELVTQIEETIRVYGIGPADGRIKIMSIQWLTLHYDDTTGDPGLIVIDEAHHALAKTYKEMWTRYPDARFLGLTATPCRLNGKGFTDLFETLIQSWTIPAFIEEGRLAVYDFVSIKTDSATQRLINSLKKRGADGDYQLKEMDMVLNKRPGIERLYRSVIQFAKDRKGIVYAISIDHARKIAEYYREQGIEAVAIDSKTEEGERRSLISRFKDGDIRILVNVDIFSEGFDCPDVEFIQLARPTLSLAKYLQMVGRGLRVAEGKRNCVILDNVGMYHVFGLPSQAWDWQTMFEGRMSSKELRDMVAMSMYSRMADSVDKPVGNSVERDPEMMLVVSHEALAEVFEQQRKRLIFETERRKLLNGEYGEIRRCGRKLVELKAGNGKNCYIDLMNMNRIPKDDDVLTDAAVVKYGQVEFIRYNDVFYTRTMRVYDFCIDPRQTYNHIFVRNFYVLIEDCLTKNRCMQLAHPFADQQETSKHVCIIAGDDTDYYWFCGSLHDGSIIVMDRKERYYLSMKGKAKEYVAKNNPDSPDEDIHHVLPRLLKDAAERQREKERRKQAEIYALNEISPFRIGAKWGLKGSDGRMIVTPRFNRIFTPIGNFCVFEQYHDQRGVMTVDGRIIVEPKYVDVKIEADGTALLKKITSEVVRMKLNP